MRFITSLLVAAQSAYASKIIYRADKAKTLYTDVTPGDYPYFFPYPGNDPDTEVGFNCSATLVSKNRAITAAHCFSKGSPQPPFEVNIGEGTYHVDEARSNGCYTKNGRTRNGADIAVLVLREDIPDTIVPRGIWDSSAQSEIGEVFRLIGYGDNGPVGVDPEAGELPYGELLTGFNKIIGTENNMVQYKFDSLDSADIQPLEAMSWSGDSGGPMLIGN